ncbi:MuDR family transposase [Actinidia rufa]|uniref:MuDR family transposase n=1 Tax=Actinidia rufa TaxID=165716 RepID=A0A7J0GFQ3_9ERIC|nr:MuDR family transposase [Actinidia rufa]
MNHQCIMIISQIPAIRMNFTFHAFTSPTITAAIIVFVIIHPIPIAYVVQYDDQVLDMAGKKVIAIIQSGGEFDTNQDGSLSYRGGDAHAREIDEKMKYKDFQMEVAELFNSNPGTMSIKYFLPGNKKTLIKISSDKDLQCMIKFIGDSNTADIYVMMEGVVATHVSNMPVSRLSRTTLSESGDPVDDPLNVVDDTTPPHALDYTTHVDAHIDTPTDMLLPFSSVGSNDEKHTKGAKEWQKNITGVGQRFNSVNEFREALHKYAIAHQFAFKFKKNDCSRVTAECRAEGCPWMIHARRLSTTQLVCIRKMNATHTCEGTTMTTGPQASSNLIASIIKEKVKLHPNYRPTDIRNDLKQEYGIKLSYHVAWAGKEMAKEQLHGSCKAAYNQLPFLCEKIMETNPGSLATFSTKEDLSFHRLYFTTESYGLTYLESIHPVPNVDRPMEEESSKSTVTVIPPPYRRHCQPPTPKSSGSKRVVKRKRQVQCSKCQGTGHNKSTCNEVSSEC